jgi:S1-C subfamily serine protease
MRGQVIGINTLKLASNYFTGIYEGMGFAIPITSAVDRFNQILANPGDIIRAEESISRYSEADKSEVSFGISGRTVEEFEVEYYDVPYGVLVDTVNADGSCGRAGILTGDIIIALDGKKVETFEKLVELKHDYNPGDEAVVRVYRDGEELDFKIIFDERK